MMIKQSLIQKLCDTPIRPKFHAWNNGIKSLPVCEAELSAGGFFIEDLHCACAVSEIFYG